jgi:hypothetical protein
MSINKIKTIALEADAVTSAKIGDNQVGVSELNVSEGTNGHVLTTDGAGGLTFTAKSVIDHSNYYTKTQTDTQVSNVVGGAPSGLNTLNEIAASIGNDVDFNSTMTTALSGKSATGHTHSVSGITDLTASAAELNYTTDVTSLIQAQIDSKSGTSHNHSGTYLPLSGGSMSGDTTFLDSVKMRFGNSGDLEIYHDTSDSYISDTGTGDLYILASNDLHLRSASNEQYIKCVANAQVDLYHNNVIKLTTKSSGTEITGNLDATGEVTAYFSDARLKDFEGRIPNPLDKVRELSGYYFKENELARSLGYSNEARQVGVSAQEVEKVLPEAVTQAVIDPTYLAVRYEKLVPLLIEAIKELSDQVEKLKK